MIPEAAVEAAASVVLENPSLRSMWDNADPEWRGAYQASLHAALEAALPHMRFELQCMSMIDEME